MPLIHYSVVPTIQPVQGAWKGVKERNANMATNILSNKIPTVQFGIKLCHTDPRLSCSFSTLNPRADIVRRDFHSVCLFTVEIWLE